MVDRTRGRYFIGFWTGEIRAQDVPAKSTFTLLSTVVDEEGFIASVNGAFVIAFG